MKHIGAVTLIILLLALVGCASRRQLSPQPSPTKPVETYRALATDSGKVVTVQVKSENVRKTPNGTRLGKLKRGEKLTVLKRVGNWVQFTNAKFKKAYIWAPSVGYRYENLYSPYFYYDTTRHAFRDIDFFRRIFSQWGQRRNEMTSSYALFFKNVGLGSHEAIVVEVVAGTKQVVEHGITLYIDKKTDKIHKVRVDYLVPVTGYKKALKKSELPIQAPVEENSGHLIWPAGTLLPDLTVDLERKEWNSNAFSSIWYIASP